MWRKLGGDEAEATQGDERDALSGHEANEPGPPRGRASASEVKAVVETNTRMETDVDPRRAHRERRRMEKCNRKLVSIALAAAIALSVNPCGSPETVLIFIT